MTLEVLEPGVPFLRPLAELEHKNAPIGTASLMLESTPPSEVGLKLTGAADVKGAPRGTVAALSLKA